MMNLRHKDETYLLRGLIYDVRNMLGLGWPEEVYHQGVVALAQDRKIPVESKPRKIISHHGIEIHSFECDAIAQDSILLEFKVLPNTSFAPAHYAQIIHYLKCWKKDLGLLINFGSPRIQIARIVWDEPNMLVTEKFDALSHCTPEEWHDIRCIRDVIASVGTQYGLGYPETMYRKILAIELASQGLNCISNIQIESRFNGHLLVRHTSEYFLINQQYLLHIRSLLDYPTRYDFAQAKTYLNSLGLKIGLIANFGKRQLQIFGVNPD